MAAYRIIGSGETVSRLRFSGEVTSESVLVVSSIGVEGHQDEELPSPCMFIPMESLERVDDEFTSGELSTTNPYGRVMYEGRYNKGQHEVAYSQHENGMQVTVIEDQGDKRVTLISKSIIGDVAHVRRLIDKCFILDEDVGALVTALENMGA